MSSWVTPDTSAVRTNSYPFSSTFTAGNLAISRRQSLPTEDPPKAVGEPVQILILLWK